MTDDELSLTTDTAGALRATVRAFDGTWILTRVPGTSHWSCSCKQTACNHADRVEVFVGGAKNAVLRATRGTRGVGE